MRKYDSKTGKLFYETLKKAFGYDHKVFRAKDTIEIREKKPDGTGWKFVDRFSWKGLDEDFKYYVGKRLGI